MPRPIGTAVVAVIEFTMVRHWFLSLAAIGTFTLCASTMDAAPEIGKTSSRTFGFKHPLVALALFPLVLVCGIFCVIADAFGIKGNAKRTAASRWGVAVCRIYAKNVKLAWRLVLGALLLATVIGAAVFFFAPKDKPAANGGGPESEKFFAFMNTVTAPLQWMVNGIKMLIGILAIIFLVTVYYAGKVLAFTPVATMVAIIFVYLVWLLSTTWKVVSEEYGKGATPWHTIVAIIPAQLVTWFLFIIFFYSMQSGWHWLVAQIPE